MLIDSPPPPHARGELRQVLVYFHPTVWSQTRFLRGISESGPPRGWCIRVVRVGSFLRDLVDAGTRFDGALACTPEPADAMLLRQLAPHGVGLGSPQRDWCGATVDSDDQAVGEAAAAHLLERGFRNVGLIADQFGLAYGEERARGFQRFLQRHGVTPRVYPYPVGVSRWILADSFVHWLREGGLPVAIFGVDDLVAAPVLRACVLAGLRVPQEVAVLGAENLDEVRFTTSPPLSSVDIPFEQIGFRAAEALHAMMSGRDPAPRKTLITPTSVVTRASTDALAVNDALLTRAYAYLRQHSAQGVTVADLERHLHASRRQIERRMAEGWGCSPMEMIQRIRVAEAKRLLAHTDRTMDDIAQAAGFSGARALLKQFKRQVRLTPAAFRAEHRSGQRN